MRLSPEVSIQSNPQGSSPSFTGVRSKTELARHRRLPRYTYGDTAAVYAGVYVPLVAVCWRLLVAAGWLLPLPAARCPLPAARCLLPAAAAAAAAAAAVAYKMPKLFLFDNVTYRLLVQNFSENMSFLFYFILFNLLVEITDNYVKKMYKNIYF